MPREKQVPRDPIGSELIREDASFAEIILQFVNGLGQRIDTMDNAIRDGDFDALRSAAHQLKGSGGGYGYPILTELATELERSATQRMLEECVASLDALKQIADRVVVDTES